MTHASLPALKAGLPALVADQAPANKDENPAVQYALNEGENSEQRKRERHRPEGYQTIEEARRLVVRVRRCSFFLQQASKVYSTDGTFGMQWTWVLASAKQLLDVLKDLERYYGKEGLVRVRYQPPTELQYGFVGIG